MRRFVIIPSYGRTVVNCRGDKGTELLNHLAPSWLYQMLNVLDSDEIARLQLKVSHSNTGRILREGADFFKTLSNNTIFVRILDNSHWSDEFTLIELHKLHCPDSYHLPNLRR